MFLFFIFYLLSISVYHLFRFCVPYVSVYPPFMLLYRFHLPYLTFLIYFNWPSGPDGKAHKILMRGLVDQRNQGSDDPWTRDALTGMEYKSQENT